MFLFIFNLLQFVDADDPFFFFGTFGSEHAKMSVYGIFERSDRYGTSVAVKIRYKISHYRKIAAVVSAEFYVVYDFRIYVYGFGNP